MIENYRIDPQATIGTLRNYDPVKQMYLFVPNCDPTRPFVLAQEFIKMIDPDNPSSQESKNPSFSFNSNVNQQINIGNFSWTTCDFVNTICKLLEPHVLAALLTDPIDLIYNIFNTYGIIQKNSANFANLSNILKNLSSSFANAPSN